MNEADLDPPIRDAIQEFREAPVGQQLADHREREGRCFRASTRFLALLREKAADGGLLIWNGDGWVHSAIQLEGTDIVVDWTVSQFEADPEKAAGYPHPTIRTKAEPDAQLGESYVLNFEDPFWRHSHLTPEPMLPSEQARQRIPERDATGASSAPTPDPAT